MSEGVDYAFSRPSVASLVDAGKRFAVRYGGPGTSGKWLTSQEALELSAAGIFVVANAEGSASGMAGGWNVGVSWARSADAHFRSCGMPADRPIYYSCDFDVTSTQWSAVANALRGAASVTGLARVGLYGGYRACQWARRDGLAPWLWQTYAWSTWTDPDGVRRLHWLPGTHLQQYRNGVIIGGADCDLDRSMVSDYGQWMIGGDKMLDKCQFGETSEAVGDLQTAMVIRGGKVGDVPYGPAEIDNNWGKRTSASLASLVGGDGSTVVIKIDGVDTTLPARNVFGVAEFVALMDLGKTGGAPVLLPHTHGIEATTTGGVVG